MRHRVSKKKMNRDMSHRQALLKNLSNSLVLHGSITTTLAKAKFVKPHIEKIVTKAKKGADITNINRIFAKVRSRKVVKALTEDLALRFKDRPGGYTRIVKMGSRAGDNAPMAKLEWVIEKKEVEKNND